MDIYGGSLPDSINPNNFPAKLWRLVNNPANEAICWDSQGEAVIIDQRRFERQILSPGFLTSGSPDAFKTTNFSSFVRQLNLYGFRRADRPVKDSQHPAGDSGTYHYFHNPNFKRNHPELVATLIRLTVNNKAKIQAGQTVNCRPPSRYQRGDDGTDTDVKRGSSSLFSPMHLESARPYYSTQAKVMKAHNGTPFPPRYPRHGEALPPAPVAADKRLPLSLNHLYASVASSSNAVHIQQGLLAQANHGHPNFGTFHPPNSPCHPGCHSPVFHYCHPNLVASHLTGSELQTGLFSPHTYNQARYPVNMSCSGDHSQAPQSKVKEEVKKCDINLDTVFQIADNVMQTSPSNCLIRVVTPEKPGPVLVATSSTCNTMLCDSPASTMQANPLCAGPILMAVAGNVSLDTYKQQEESVLSVPEQMPEDAIFEVTSNAANDSEGIDVKVSNSEAYQSGKCSSSCSGRQADL